jgi:HlyD family secretion protein
MEAIKFDNKILVLSMSLILGLTSCHRLLENKYDASGTFEATEVVVSAEANGKIMDFNLEEGQQLTENQVVGYIDSTQLYLTKLQLQASQKSVRSRIPDIKKQIAVLQQQIETAKKEQKRIQNLFSANAASQKQLDDVNAQVSVLEKQLEAAKSNLDSTSKCIWNENEAFDILIEKYKSMEKCRITSPIMYRAGKICRKRGIGCCR